jgi:SAM domain (Sterile alpha motif)
MQRVVDWLEKLGLSEYAARFAENGIDVSVLRYLTDQDLKDIGVLLGHDILAPIYNWFTEALGTSDLKEAKVLLDQLT